MQAQRNVGFLQENIGRLDIAMKDSSLMSVMHRPHTVDINFADCLSQAGPWVRHS